MLNSRATYEGLLALAPDERPFVLTRASFAGGQRYAATWTGDNDATWSHLRISIPMLENLGLSGFAWSGADVGGFAGSPSADLLTRWIEVAAFTPLFRDHSGKGTSRHEPWVDGPAHTDIRRRFIEERYRLMPYLYALADQTARTGVPPMRPLFLEFPAAVSFLRDAPEEFLLGPDLLVAPQPQGETRDPWDVTLPGTGWYDFWTGARVTPDRNSEDGEVVREIPALERLPVFVRPGTILPRQSVVQSTAERPSGPLRLDVFPGPDCRGELYWDDGHSRKRERGGALRQTLRCEETAGGLKIVFGARDRGYPPWWREIDVAVHGWTSGVAASARLGADAIAAQYDSEAHAVRMKLPDQPGPATLVVERRPAG
jgi:alpha-glucosidase